MVAAQIFLALASTTFGSDVQLLCFGASWCGPCREMQPVLARLSSAGYPLRKIDVDQQAELAQRYQVSVVPAFVLVDGSGRVVGRIDRAATLDELLALLGHDRERAGPSTVRGQTPALSHADRVQPDATSPILQTPPRSIGAEHGPTNSLDLNDVGRTQQSALSSTVRLRVEDATGHSFGTGTVIDVQGDKALVLTCGHIFRESQGNGQIVVDRFDSTSAPPSIGRLISYDLDLDIGLVTIQANSSLRAVALASQGEPSRPGDQVFSVGCNHGEPPTVVEGRINHLNRYLGPANITASGRPVDGRSGGGLFDRNGRLLGVCTAADPEADEGIYAALQRVYAELDRSGLSFVYQKEPARQDRSVSVASAAVPSKTRPTSSESPHAAPTGAVANVAALERARHPQLKSLPARNIMASYEVADASGQGSASELVCVLRSAGAAEGRVFIIKDPSRVLVEYLAREADKR